jgi:hypothetical protein
VGCIRPRHRTRWRNVVEGHRPKDQFPTIQVNHGCDFAEETRHVSKSETKYRMRRVTRFTKKRSSRTGFTGSDNLAVQCTLPPPQVGLGRGCDAPYNMPSHPHLHALAIWSLSQMILLGGRLSIHAVC